MRCLVAVLVIPALGGCALFPEPSPEEREGRAARRAFELEYKAKEQAERQKRESSARTESWLPGRLTALTDGTVLPLRVEKVFVFGNSASGGMVATHPKTGETFTGRYTAIMEGNRSGQARVTSPTGQHLGTAQYHEKGRNADAVGTLTGSMGTIIQVQMQSKRPGKCNYASVALGGRLA